MVWNLTIELTPFLADFLLAVCNIMEPDVYPTNTSPTCAVLKAMKP